MPKPKTAPVDVDEQLLQDVDDLREEFRLFRESMELELRTRRVVMVDEHGTVRVVLDATEVDDIPRAGMTLFDADGSLRAELVASDGHGSLDFWSRGDPVAGFGVTDHGCVFAGPEVAYLHLGKSSAPVTVITAGNVFTGNPYERYTRSR